MKRLWWLAAAVVLLVLFVVAAGTLALRSDWFHRKVHARIVNEIEKATGGRVEMKSFRFEWKAMRASVDGLVVHGSEKAGQPPLFAADRVSLGMKILSVWRREVDLRSLEIESPRIHYTGSNIPAPAAARDTGKDPFVTLLELAVGSYGVRKGEFRYRDARYPFEVSGKDLDVRLDFDREGAAYEGDFKAGAIAVSQPFALPRSLAVSGHVRFEQERVSLSNAKVSAGLAHVDGKGEWRNGEARMELDATSPLQEWAQFLPPGVAARGEGRFKGTVRYRDARDWQANGAFAASGLGYRDARGIDVQGIDVSGPVEARPDGVRSPAISVRALGGLFEGDFRIEQWKTFQADGEISGFSISRLAKAANRTAPSWDATIDGPVRVQGPGLMASADLRLTPAAGSSVRGEVRVRFEQRTGDLAFEPSFLELPHSRVNFSGTLQKRIEAGVISKDLNDFLPLLGVESLPVKLEQGLARFDGSVSGNVDSPTVRGAVRIGPFAVANQTIREVEADIEATSSRVSASRLRVAQNGLALQGAASAQLSGWRLSDASAVSAKLTMGDTSIEHLMTLASVSWPVEGTVSAAFEVDGTLAAPRASGVARSPSVRAWDETLERLEAEFKFSGTNIQIQNGRARKANQGVEFAGSLDNNDVRLQVKSHGTRLRDWNAVMERQPNLDGSIGLEARIVGRRSGSKIQVTSLDGDIAVEELKVSGLRVGDLRATARTRGRVTVLTMNGQVRDSVLRGSAEWSVASGSGLGQLYATNLTFAALRDLGLFGDPGTELPIKGTLDAEIGFSGPILRPDLWTGLAKVTKLEVESARAVPTRGNGARFVLRNREPLLVAVDNRGANLQAVHLVAEGTDLEATGTVSYRSRNPWNLRLLGRVNLPVLSSFEPDLLATGVSTIDATVRGSLARPNVTVRMEIRDASLGLRNVANGLDKVTGAVVFDRTRANIEKITAQTGGGELALTGFVDFGGNEWLYTLQGQAQRVRVRYPESMSSTLNGAVTLSGTSARSLLSGRVIIQRVAIDPRTDIGGLLAAAGRGGQVPSAPPNDFLRNMQLDLRVVTAPDAELQSSLARDVAPEANLEVRGSAVRPVLLGRISMNQGEIQFFGNQYTIARADISFFNPVRIEPVMDLDLETKIRGVTVNINFTGPVNKLDVSYRSDPPLQSAEIVALLAVGRTPGSGITPNLPTQNQALLQPGNNTLLGQAVTAPINDRLTRLFGVSRIKIDPELTGVTNTPQARLTIEQQLSRDITVTYITNLNRTQQQVVRLQWDFSRDFSVLAVRDENGVFGIDFLWRKRFK